MTLMTRTRKSSTAKIILALCSLSVLSLLLISWLPGIHTPPAVPAKLASRDLRVVVSITPLHSLVKAVMWGVAEPQLLIKGKESPHTFHLKPSDAEKLHRADLIIWVGPSIESFLGKVIDTSSPKTMTLEALPTLRLLPVRRGADWQATCDHDHQGHHHGHDHGHEHGHQHEFCSQNHDPSQNLDGHFWLDPERTATFVAHVTQTLSLMDPVHASVYQRNGAELTRHLQALRESLTQRLKKVATIPFMVFHDAYQYLEHGAGLRCVGSLVVEHDVPLSAGHLHTLIARAKKLGVRCIFAEPQFPEKQAIFLAEQLGCRMAVLDPLAPPESSSKTPASLATDSINTNAPDYFAMMHQLADVLVRGLDDNGS